MSDTTTFETEARFGPERFDSTNLTERRSVFESTAFATPLAKAVAVPQERLISQTSVDTPRMQMAAGGRGAKSVSSEKKPSRVDEYREKGIFAPRIKASLDAELPVIREACKMVVNTPAAIGDAASAAFWTAYMAGRMTFSAVYGGLRKRGVWKAFAWPAAIVASTTEAVLGGVLIAPFTGAAAGLHRLVTGRRSETQKELIEGAKGYGGSEFQESFYKSRNN